MFVGHAAFITHFIYKAVDEAHNRVGHIRALGVLEAALRVVAFRHAASDTTRQEKRLSSFTVLKTKHYQLEKIATGQNKTASELSHKLHTYLYIVLGLCFV